MGSRNAEKPLISILLQALRRRRIFAHVDVGAKPSNVAAHELGYAGEPTQVHCQTLLELVEGSLTNRFVKLVKSRDWSIRPGSTSLLIILNLILHAFIAVELSSETVSMSRISSVHEPEDERLFVLKAGEFNLPSRHLFDIISDRPLFHPLRRKVIDSPPEIEPQDITIELLGTFLSSAERMALVRLGTEERAIWVKERDYISSWIVDTILAERLRLRSVDGVQIIDLWPKIESHPG